VNKNEPFEVVPIPIDTLVVILPEALIVTRHIMSCHSSRIEKDAMENTHGEGREGYEFTEQVQVVALGASE